MKARRRRDVGALGAEPVAAGRPDRGESQYRFAASAHNQRKTTARARARYGVLRGTINQEAGALRYTRESKDTPSVNAFC
jgi:hypothetical protein